MRYTAAVYFLCGGLLCVFRGNRRTADVWCARVLPGLRRAICAFSMRFPFPLVEALALILVFWILCGPSRRRRRRLAAVSAALCLSLTCTWAPLFAMEDAPAPRELPDAAALSRLCARLSSQAAQERRSLPEDARGRALLPYAMGDLMREAARLCDHSVIPKASRCSELMSALGISGWWSPMTGEVVVDCSLPAAALPFALCHELAHARGIADEGEANLYAWEVCRLGPAAFRYSGAISTLWYGMGALRATDAAAWQDIVDRMNDAVYRDFRAMNGLSTAEVPFLAQVQDLLTRLYLRLTGTGEYATFLSALV